MNKENLLKMAEHLRTIPQEKFVMQIWRDGGHEQHECNSIGCAVGHCTVLDDPENIPRLENGQIDFYEWSWKFTDLFNADEWEWCFDGGWSKTDNTPEGVASRIEWLVEKGLPKNWLWQMAGTEPLCYK